MNQFNLNFARHWDELVNWDEKIKNSGVFLPSLLKKLDCNKILDASLGTGFDSVTLIQNGFDVTSVDLSEAMIEIAKKNASKYSVTLNAIQSNWIDLDKKVTGKFDAVICLGNSFACEMDSNNRDISFRNWSQLIKPNGYLLVDRRNYESLLTKKYVDEMSSHYRGSTVKIKHEKVEENATTFSYTFSDGEKFALDMFPILDTEIQNLSEKNNLELTQIYGDFLLNNVNDSVSFYLYALRKTV